jgi:hypothetical protein
MTFLNAAILFGLGLTAIPVILHLLLRNKPKKLPFPALRLLMLSKKSNTRRLRLKHIWLLLLRILLIALMVLALARPTLPAADYSLSAAECFRIALIPVAALAIDWWLRRRMERNYIPASVQRSRQATYRSLLGVACLVLFLLLFLWPYGKRIMAQWGDPASPIQENFPVSAALLFDVSPSMEYRQDNHTRLDSARQLAEQLLSRLPAGSQLSVTHNATTDPAVFLSDTSAARERLDTLKTSERTEFLDRRLQTVIDLQNRDRERILEQFGSAENNAGNDRFLREIYIFTDMASHAWRMSASRSIQRQIEDAPWLAVYFVDVSALTTRNVTVEFPKLSAEAVPRGSTLVVRSELSVKGMTEDEQTVDLWMKNPDGEFVKQGRQSVSLTDREGAVVEFPLSAQTQGFLEGKIQLVNSDPLTFDNTRYFTAEVIAPPRVLVISDDEERRDVWSAMLSSRKLYQAAPRASSVLEDIDLTDTDIVCLLSVASVPEKAWLRLEEFVNRGGGLFISLGTEEIDTISYSESVPARNLMPGQPDVYKKFRPPEYLDFGVSEHPLLDRLEELGGPGGLLDTEVRYRRVIVPVADARTILSYTDAEHSPALVERLVGRGRVMLLTTSILPGKWNDLFQASADFFVLSHLMVQSLQQQNLFPRNLQVGDVPVVPLPLQRDFSEYLYRTAGLQQTAGKLERGAETLQLGPLEEAGHYDVRSRPPGFRIAFSANIPLSESDLTALRPGELNDLFGADRHSVARSLEELEPVIRSRRLGREMVPLLLLLVALIFITEQFVANRFYDEDQAEQAVSPSLKHAA